MADIYGSNYQLEYVDVPSQQGAPGESGGRVKCMYDAWTGATPGADDVYLGKIPGGARILRISDIAGAAGSGTYSLAPGAKVPAGDPVDLVLTTAGDSAAAGAVFCEYILD
jgi:hypothetical protein